jgi:hypothetical protein
MSSRKRGGTERTHAKCKQLKGVPRNHKSSDAAHRGTHTRSNPHPHLLKVFEITVTSSQSEEMRGHPVQSAASSIDSMRREAERTGERCKIIKGGQDVRLRNNAVQIRVKVVRSTTPPPQPLPHTLAERGSRLLLCQLTPPAYHQLTTCESPPFRAARVGFCLKKMEAAPKYRDYSLTGPEGKLAVKKGLASAQWYVR